MQIEDLKAGDHVRYAGREVVVVHVGPRYPGDVADTVYIADLDPVEQRKDRSGSVAVSVANLVRA